MHNPQFFRHANGLVAHCIISLLAFHLQTHNFDASNSHCCSFAFSICYQIACWNLSVHEFSQSWYVSTTIHIFTNLFKAQPSSPTRYSPKPQDYNLLFPYSTIGLLSHSEFTIELNRRHSSTQFRFYSNPHSHSKPLWTWSILTSKSFKIHSWQYNKTYRY